MFSIFYVIVGTMFAGDAAWGILTYRRLRNRWLKLLALVFALSVSLGLVAIFIGRRFAPELDHMLPRWVHGTIIVWHLLVLPVWGVWHLCRVSARPMKKRVVPAPAGLPPIDEPAVNRREFFVAAAAYTPPLLALGAAAVGEGQLETFRVRKVEVPLPQLPPELDGITIAHVTDVHVGRFTRGAVLGAIADQVNGLNVDLVAMTGDLINDSLRAMPAAMEMVRAFRARAGVVSCEGNHDLFEDPRRFYREAEQGGLHMLRGEIATLEIRGRKVQVLGLPWARNAGQGNESTRAFLNSRDPSAFAIMLAHHPHAWDEASGIPLTLAGHTHGGQLMLSRTVGFGPWMYRYWSGLYQRQDQALVVSNGVGNWFPLRINAPAEIVHLTLRAAPPGRSA